MKRAALSLGLAASMFSSASASDGCRDIQYHAYSQPVIDCPVSLWRDGDNQVHRTVLLCELIFGRDERIHRALSSEADQWDPNEATDIHFDAVRPVLVLKPEAENLMASFAVFTSKRSYNFIVRSIVVQGVPTCITRFQFDDEHRSLVRLQSRSVASSAKPKPETRRERLERLVNAAVAYTAAQRDVYGTDPQPDDYRILRVAHSADHTYIQLEPLTRTPSTVPQIMDTEGAPRLVDAPYDPDLRLYTIAGVSREYTLTIPDGKKTHSVRVQRQQRHEIAKRGR
jgi:hypothetical protein